MKIAIIYRHLFDRRGEHQTIGGIQTYIIQLASLCIDLGYSTTVYQPSDEHFTKHIKGFSVIGIPCAQSSHKKQITAILEIATKNFNVNKDLVIFAADHYSIKSKYPRCLSIQHGISWDLPVEYLTEKKFLKTKLGGNLKKLLSCRQAVRYFNNSKYHVCVDYNFANWFKTLSTTWKNEASWVIPNFCERFTTEEAINARIKRSGNKSIIFARRLTSYRGVYLMADAIKKLRAKHPRMKFTFAGEGPEETSLKKTFAKDNQVAFVKYLPDECLNILQGHDISVIPSIASEGTCLSVAEAMGAGCVVIACAAGGITNMIIDGYNGILIKPNSTSIVAAIESIIKQPEFEASVIREGYRTATKAFCLDKWRKSWTHVLTCLS